MIWFWRSELQGGLQSLNYGVSVQQLSEAKAFTAGYDLSHWGELADCCRCDLIIKNLLLTLDKAYQMKWKMATMSKAELLLWVDFWKCLIQNHNIIFDKNQWTSFINIPKLVSIAWNLTKAKTYSIKETCLTEQCTLLLKSVFLVFLCQPNVKMHQISEQDLWLSKPKTSYPSAQLFSLTDATLMVCGISSSQKLLCLVN